MIDETFDDEYASPSQWARMYRKAGMQVVPAMHFSEVKGGVGWKRPAVRWAEFERELVGNDLFEEWYGLGGKFSGRRNMGFITGECSNWAFMVDLDTHKNPFARIWWQGIHDDHAGGIISETPTQTTGGGGKQYLFLAPRGWIPPTIRTEKGVDIRGRGGFAMLPPSMHESGKPYEWDIGPWEIPIMVAPKWMCDEIDRLVLENGGSLPSSEVSVSLPSAYIGGNSSGTTGIVKNDFGMIVDGREAQMTKMIFGRMVDEYRKDPTPPADGRQQHIAIDLFKQYVSLVKPRLENPLKEKYELLEEEGRGSTLFMSKFFDALRKWDTKIRRAAMSPPPQSSNHRENSEGSQTKDPEPNPEDIEAIQDEFSLRPERMVTFLKDPSVFEFLSIEQIFALPDPQYLVKDLFIGNGLCFIYGAPGCGKTFIALDLALSIATGQESWWGKEIEKTGPVLYISSEGISDMKFRIKAWSEAKGANVTDINFKLAHESMNFMKEEDVTKLCRSVDQWIMQMEGEMPVMIVVDTVSRVLSGADENLQKDMTLFVQACDKLRSMTGCAVLGVHHVSRGGDNMRGSTVLDGAADSAFLVVKENTEMEGSFFAKKIKTAPSGWTWTFAVDLMPLISGYTSLVVSKVEEPAPMNAAAFNEAFGGAQETNKLHLGHKHWPQQQVFSILNALQDDFEAGRGWTYGKTQNTPRHYANNMKLLFKIDKEDAKDILDALYVKNMITEDVNKNTHTKCYKLGQSSLPSFVRKQYER